MKNENYITNKIRYNKIVLMKFLQGAKNINMKVV